MKVNLIQITIFLLCLISRYSLNQRSNHILDGIELNLNKNSALYKSLVDIGFLSKNVNFPKNNLNMRLESAVDIKGINMNYPMIQNIPNIPSPVISLNENVFNNPQSQQVQYISNGPNEFSLNNEIKSFQPNNLVQNVADHSNEIIANISNNINSNLLNYQSSKNQISNEIITTTSQVQSLEKKVDVLNTKISKKEAKLSMIQDKIDQAKKEYKSLKEVKDKNTDVTNQTQNLNKENKEKRVFLKKNTKLNNIMRADYNIPIDQNNLLNTNTDPLLANQEVIQPTYNNLLVNLNNIIQKRYINQKQLLKINQINQLDFQLISTMNIHQNTDILNLSNNYISSLNCDIKEQIKNIVDRAALNINQICLTYNIIKIQSNSDIIKNSLNEIVISIVDIHSKNEKNMLFKIYDQLNNLNVEILSNNFSTVKNLIKKKQEILNEFNCLVQINNKNDFTLEQYLTIRSFVYNHSYLINNDLYFFYLIDPFLNKNSISTPIANTSLIKVNQNFVLKSISSIQKGQNLIIDIPQQTLNNTDYYDCIIFSDNNCNKKLYVSFLVKTQEGKVAEIRIGYNTNINLLLSIFRNKNISIGNRVNTELLIREELKCINLFMNLLKSQLVKLESVNYNNDGVNILSKLMLEEISLYKYYLNDFNLIFMEINSRLQNSNVLNSSIKRKLNFTLTNFEEYYFYTIWILINKRNENNSGSFLK